MTHRVRFTFFFHFLYNFYFLITCRPVVLVKSSWPWDMMFVGLFIFFFLHRGNRIHDVDNSLHPSPGGQIYRVQICCCWKQIQTPEDSFPRRQHVYCMYVILVYYHADTAVGPTRVSVNNGFLSLNALKKTK